MAQGGFSSGMDVEDGEETEDFWPLPFMDPFILGLKKEGDEKFEAQLYAEAAAIYTIAMNCPTLPFMDTSVIAEKLFRKRAVCFYKMGKYLEAIQDCERAIEHADCSNNKNLLAKSVFIKMKAIVCLGDFVPAFKLAVWCKHLRPNCEKTKECLNDIKEKLREAFTKDRSLIKEVLETMIDFAETLNIENNTREVALESYTELLDLLDFMLLPGVLQRQAEILMNLGRYKEAKDICAKVLWLRRDDLEALELMRCLKEREKKQAKETKEQSFYSSTQNKTNEAKRGTSLVEMKAAAAESKDCQPLLSKVESQASFSREQSEEFRTNNDAMMIDSNENAREHDRENAPHLGHKNEHCSQVSEESPLTVEMNDAQIKMPDSDQTQSKYAGAKENEKAERRRKKNRKKKKKKKEKKKAQQQMGGSSDQAPVSNVDEGSGNESPDEGDSQATDSVLGDPDILGYQTDCSTTMGDRKASFTTSNTTFGTLEVNQDEDSDGGDFIPVQNTRRAVLSIAKPSNGAPEFQKPFGERASVLDWIDAPSGQEYQSVAEVNAGPLTPEPSTSQLQGIPASVGFRKEDNADTPEVRRSLSFDEFPNLTKEAVNRPTPDSMHMHTSGNAWDNISPPDASLPNSSLFQSEVRPRNVTNEQFSSMSYQGIPGQTSSSTGFACFTRTGQAGSSSNPVTFSQSFQTNSAKGMHSLNPPPGLAGPIRIPEGVFVVCDHFLQNIIRAKTCKFCQERGILKYAAWNKDRYDWQVMRPYPRYKVPPRAIFDVCKHFASDRPCPKDPCTFPHGEQETIMWTLERQGLLASPEESLQLMRASTAAASMITEPVVQDNGANNVPLLKAETRGASMASFGGSTLDGYSDLRALCSQTSTTGDSNNANASIWSSPLEMSGGSFEAAPYSEDPVVTAPHVSRIEAFSSQSSTADSSARNTSPAGSFVTKQSENTFSPVPPVEKPIITTSHVGYTEAVSFQSSPVDSSECTTSPTWSAVVKKSAHATSTRAEHVITTSASHESPGRPSASVPPSTSPANMTSQVAQNGGPSPSSAADSSTFTSSSSRSSRLEPDRRPSSPFASSVKPANMTSPAAPPSKTAAAPLANSDNDFRKIPKGVYVVCDDFLWKNLKRPASIHEKTKACKGCENRSRLKYAVWSDNSKQWQLIRPYPAEKVPANVAFKECAHHASNIQCLKNPCSFAHGQLELIVWTMEREGVLPSPRETLIGSSASMTSASKEASSTLQPPVQLRYRPSPPGVTDGSYRMCKSFRTHERCRYGRGCIFAHSQEELNEWKQEYDRKRKEKLRKDNGEKEEICSLEIASKILKGPAKDRVEYLPGVEVTCSPPELNIRLQDKNESHKFKWTFSLIFKTHDVGYLEQVLLLHRYHNCYQLSDIRVRCYQDTPGCQSYKLCCSAKLNDTWYKSPSTNRPSGRVEVCVTVSFDSRLYGSFEQLVLFDFGKKPYLVKKLNADVMSESLSQTSIVPEQATASAEAVWDEVSMEVIRFVHGTSEAVQAEHLSRTYCLPKKVEITAETLSPAVYKSLMHQILFVEEGFMKDEISRYTLNKTQLHAQWNIFDEMTGMKCAVDGELFGVLRLQEEDALRPDDAAGRLLYRNVSSVWVKLVDSVSNIVYEAPVEKVESECVVLRLSSKLCSDLKLHDTCDTEVNAQFQLNRKPLCEMHAAVDRLTKGQLRLIFPEPRTETVKSDIKIRWQWLLDERLNKNQKEVIERIASPEYNAPPLVVFGPFGTGKTFTLYQAVRLLVQVDKSHRILLCTHSNRAADIHVELLHEYLTKKNGIPAARPLRVYQPMRRLETASETARKYCLIKNGTFVLPSRDDLVEHRVVVTTLSTSRALLDLQVLHGFFTHILIDEAAQALEPEALTPLILAGPNTKVVFTGDHMQMSPEVYSPQARSLGLQKSLAERLFDVYDKHKAETSNSNPREDPNVLFLTENYRCHKEILQFPSDNFYGEKLVARGHDLQPEHPKYGPLLFFSARGKEKKEHDNSYINLSEVYEVAKRVKEIADSWPAIWGPKKLSDIAVLSSYRYQVQAIRNSLRKDPDLRDVNVDTIHNVQGEEFRVLFISTVRTFHTCKPQQQELLSSGSDRKLYWEFLSDPKLLNTAVTRARCLVAVIGDPVSLCTVGECRSIWRDYIKRCNKKGGLYGTTLEELEKEINASIASIELDPKAQPFVPTFPKIPDKSSTVDVTQEKGAQRDEETEEGKRRVENEGDSQLSETHGRESHHQQEIDKNVTKDDSQDVKSGPCVNPTTQCQEERETGEDEDDETAESGDFQDNFLEDETIFPRDMDEIILAFVRKCEETLQIDAQGASIFQDSEFPTLQAAKDVNVKHQPVSEAQRGSFKGGADIKDLFPEVRVVNGRVEVRLTNLGFYTSPSDRAKKIMISSKQQEFLDPSVLMKLLKDEPEKYIVCNLRLSPERSQIGYADVEDTKTPSISIKGRIRQAFDKDKVVVELVEKKVRSKEEGIGPLTQGKVVGVLEHIIPPHERQFVCSTDYENPVLMVPINKSATKLVNLTDKSCKDIPVYKRDQNERATKVKMIKREEVLSGKYLFVVKYLQWRRDFSCPLGIVVRTLSRGEDLKSSMEIAYAEHGIRRVFKQETKKYVKENFPPEWSIPEAERKNRTTIVGAITIDPPKSLDLDDALTIENDASSSTFLVGIHIADVSFFVKPNSPLDHEAFLRCTSYYPGDGQENVPMLPRELSEKVCSLLPNEDRLAVSVFAPLDEEGKLTAEPEIKRTIIRSCCRLSYAEAQTAIHCSSVSCIRDISEEILEKIRQLSSLAQKRRRLRLGDCAFDHWQNEGRDHDEAFEAHELVEEMMILANEEIAKLLSQKSSELAPLRIQLPPKDHRLAEWVEMHGKYARLSLTFSEMFKNVNVTTEASTRSMLHDERVKFKVQRSVWSAMCQAADSSDLPRLHQLICNENNHPQVAVAMSNFRRIQSESRYVCEGDQPPENIFHYSLKTRCYTHFTSPIRRYIDIVVHRLLLASQSGSCYAESPSKDDIAKACRRSTFMLHNARKFDKDCRRIHMANQLQHRCRETRVFIESIEHRSISLHISNHEDDHLAGKQKRVLLSHLNLVELKEEEETNRNENTIFLKWKFRKYVAPDASSKTKKVSTPDYSGIGDVAEIPSDIWLRVLDAVRANNDDNLATIIKQTEKKLGILSTSRGRDEPTQPLSPHNVPSVPYKHPHHNEKAALSSEETLDHFYEKSIVLRKYQFFSVQLCPHMTRGILQPDIQIFKVDAHVNICIEHHRYPRESFAHTARHQASRERYGTIDEYIRAWKPVLAMEAATEAVKENDAFIIENLNVVWKHELKSNNVRGTFTLLSSYCDSRQLTFFSGDLACIRVPYCDSDTVSGDETSNERKSSADTPRSGDSRQGSDLWVVHCIVKEATYKKEIKSVKVKLELHQSSSNIPDWLTHGSGQRCTLELIHRTLPQRRMYAALCIELEDSTELVHAICKGEEPSKENYGEDVSLNLSLVQHGFQMLNRYQETAVREALSNPFTLIQGPPGTGKTVTGVHIAYWFAERNKRLKSDKVLGKDTDETECAGACKAPPQVIYCGPSNKSVDVVTEYLLRIPNLKILRVYSDQIEQREFPVPNKLKPPRTSRSDEELKISSDKIRCVSLHHVIRGPECPFSQELRQYEEGFEQCKAQKERIGQKEVNEYCKLIGKAEKWVLQESGVQIILCTCAASGSLRLTSCCDNIQQCIVDECGMCMEPESLVPITCSGARQVVLIGDHKQLQPVIQDQVAKTLGLSVSMFERHSNRAKMLELQYRMHDGICEFPSKQFYGEKLQTAASVKSRGPSPVTFWPAQVRRQRNLPIVFCHVEGQEESSVISTSESNEESKRNMKEVRKAVQIAKYLVNRHRQQVRMSDVVILSPYREQRSKITELLKGAYEDIKVTTVTKSQGSEWDYVIISLVRSLKRDEIDAEPSLSWLREHLGFLTDEHQMNVGLTRARRGLCIIGNKYLLGMDPMWKSLLQHYEDNHCLVDDAWPWS